MGAVLHTVNVRMPAEQVLYTVNHAADDVLIVNSDFLPLLAPIRARLRQGLRIVVASDSAEAVDALDLAGQYEGLLARADPGFRFPDVAEDSRATTFYTTGTTGLPKGVYFSHRQLVQHALAVSSHFANASHAGFTARDVYMPITPMFHVHAWGFPYIATMIGAKQVYPGRYSPDALLGLIEREKVTFSHCVPTLLQMILSQPGGEALDLRGWKVVVGGSALPLALARAARERGVDVVAGYGMSETGPILTMAHLLPEMASWDEEESLPYRCRAGRPVPLVQLRIVDPDMNDVPHDGESPGEIVVRAPWLTQGYLHETERSEQLWEGGWLHTGDVGVIGPYGYVKIVDRMKDVVKTGGEWISSLELEDLILRMPGVAEAAVVGVPDEKWGERPVALIVPRAAGNAPDEEAVRRHVGGFADRGEVSPYAVPDRVHVVSEIPKTSVGKLDKKAIRASLLANVPQRVPA